MTTNGPAWRPALDERGPVYLAVTRALEADIRAGRLRPEQRLPTHRDLAAHLGVNVGTISRAYAEARRRGLIHGEVGRGTFVSAPSSSSMKLVPTLSEGHPGFLELGVNLPLREPGPGMADALRALADAVEHDPDALGYQAPEGARAVRRAGAKWFEGLGQSVSPDEIVACAGAQHGILVSLASIVGPGELVLAESLTYPGLLGAARTLGLRVAPVALDEGGLIPEALEEICARERPRLLYCMPSLQNPTTAVLGEARLDAIAQIAEEHDLVVVQDDIQGALLDRPALGLAARVPERVITIAGLSKNLAPGLRVAFVSAARRHIDRLSDAVWSSVWMANPIGALLAAHWIENGDAARLARARRDEMDQRHEVAARALRGLAWRTTPGSYHGWLELDHGWTGASFAAALLREGVGVTEAAAFAVEPATAPAAVRISLSSPRDPDSLGHALERVAHSASAAAEPAPVRL